MGACASLAISAGWRWAQAWSWARIRLDPLHHRCAHAAGTSTTAAIVVLWAVQRSLHIAQAGVVLPHRLVGLGKVAVDGVEPVEITVEAQRGGVAGGIEPGLCQRLHTVQRRRVAVQHGRCGTA